MKKKRARRVQKSKRARSSNPGRSEPAPGAADCAAQDAIKLVWVASMPRTGSMWAYNVSRSVLRRAGRNVLPKNVLKSSKDTFALAAQAFQDRDPANVWTLKVHGIVESDFPHARFITTHRDLRDALVSYKRFMRCDFECALDAMIGSVSLIDFYRNLPDELCMHLNYRDIVKTPREVVQRIAGHIGCPITSEIASEVADEFSKENVKQRIQDTEASLKRRAAGGDLIAPAEVVDFGSQNQRAFDLTTGFQTGHVSDYREGDWKNALTLEEKDRMFTVLTPWLQRNGYLDTETPV